MCGIAGILSLNGEQRLNTNPIRQMTRAMAHRGPDDEGYLIADKADRMVQIFKGPDTPPSTPRHRYYPQVDIADAVETAGHLFLGHRRLSIIDLSESGHQPMCTADGRYWIVYNGEIYNYRELIPELQRTGVQFSSQSDTEVLLYAYQQWGPAALHHFNGMFACAIWDNHEKSLFCCRDRVGIKPFYYTISDDQFIFGSDIKTVLASKLFKPQVDLEGLYHTLSFSVAPRPMTAFKDIKALEQGSWLLIHREGRFERQTYWRLPIGKQRSSMTEADAKSMVSYELEKSVRRRLVADVPIGTFMSGGIDSTTVSAIAAQNHPGIKAFTLAYQDEPEEYDELSQAKKTVRMYDMEHIVHLVQADSILENLEDMILCFEEPCSFLDPNYLISRVVSENNTKVVLNGLGGDEVFYGYNHYRSVKRSRWRLFRRIAPILRILQPINQRWEKLYRIATTPTIDRLHTVLRSEQTEQSKQRLFSSPLVKEFNSIERLHQLYVGKHIEFSDELEAFSYMDFMNVLGNHHTYRVDQFTMHFSIEGRFPFLDHELIEAASLIPSRYKVNEKIRKYILRKVAADLIDRSSLEMPKKGFRLPYGTWMRGPLKEILHQKIDTLAQRDLFDGTRVRTYLDEFEAGKRSYSHVWHLVAVELWLELFIDGNLKTITSSPPA